MSTTMINGDHLIMNYHTNEEKLNIENFETEFKKSLLLKEETINNKELNREMIQKNKRSLHSIHNFEKFQLNFTNVLEKFSIKNKPIQIVRGDLKPLNELDENFISKNFATSNQKRIDNYNNLNHDHNALMNNMFFTHISKEDFKKTVKERNPTPPKKENIKIEIEEEFRSIRKSHTIVKSNKNPKKDLKSHKILTDENSVIKLPPEYTTDDVDLKTLCDLINEPTGGNWKNVLNENAIKIYKKSIKNVPQIMIRTIAIIDNYTRDEIFEAISNVNIRKQWDKVFSEFKIVETNDKEQFEDLYMAIKSSFPFISDRDFVQRRKIWKDFPDESSTVLHFKSVDHKDCPIHKNIVRAQTIISGYFIKSISDNPPKTYLSIISQNDVKGKIPTYLVNKVSQTAPKDWVNSLLKGCNIVKQKNKK